MENTNQKGETLQTTDNVGVTETQLTKSEITCRVIERNRELAQLNKVICVVDKMFQGTIPNHVSNTLVNRRWECANELREFKKMEDN